MKELFTVEEINLMCIFDMSSRNALMSDLIATTGDFEDEEILEIAIAILQKLATMSDEDFAAIDPFPEYGDYDEEV